MSIEHQSFAEAGDGAGQRERVAPGVGVPALQALRAKREAALRRGAHGGEGLSFAGVPSGVRLADTRGDAKAQDQLGAVFMKYSSKQPGTALLARKQDDEADD